MTQLELAPAHDHDPVAVHDGLQSVCHGKHGARHELLSDRALDQAVRSGGNSFYFNIL